MQNPRGSLVSNRSRKSNHSNYPPQVTYSYRNYQSCSEEQIDNMQPAFQTQNFLYQLQSRCNTLEYENTKNAMIHENIVNELKQKNDYLEQVAAKLSHQNQALLEERQELRDLLNQIREQNFVFSKEISSLRIQINNLENSPIKIDDSHLKEENFIKDETIAALQKEVASMTSTLQSTDKQRQRLKLELQELKNENEAISKQIKSKQKEHQEEKIKLLSQIEEMKSQYEIRSKKINSGPSNDVIRLTELVQSKDEHLKTLQNDRATLENKLNETLLDVGRLKCQKTNLQQYNAYLESTAKQNQQKRKSLQQQVFKNERQLSDLRTQLFNQKIENKKQVNNLKLQFEEQKMNYIEQVQQKSKELSKLRQYSCQSNRQAFDMEELSAKNQDMLTDLQKANKQISQLKSENAKLKSELEACEAKLDKKHEKLCTLQSKMKGQKDERLKALQSQIYSLQQINNQLEIKLQLAQGKSSGRQQPQQHNNNELFDLLKDQLKEEKQRVKQLENKQRQYNQQRSSLYDQISRLEGELRMARDIRNSTSNDSKVGTIELLQQEIDNLNHQVQEERNKVEQKRKEANTQKEQLLDEISKLQKEQQRINIVNSQQNEKIVDLEEQLKYKDNIIEDLQEEIKQLKVRKQQMEDYTKVNLIQEARHDISVIDLQQKYMNLQRENVTLKQQYAKSLQQINTILVKYQAAEQKYSKLLQKDRGQANSQQKNRISQLQMECQRLRKVINHQQEEERRLLKMINQMQYQINNHGKSREGSARKFSTDTLWLNKDAPTSDRNNSNRNSHKYHYVHRI